MVNNYLNPSKYPNAPSELPSIVRLEEPIKHLEISAVCCQEEYAIEQAARIKRTIDSNFEYAIELGCDKSSSYYQHIRRDGKRITYE